MAKPHTTEQFIKKCIKIHGTDKYDYSEINYVNNRTKIKIICKVCGNIFYQRPDNHIYRMYGCPICAKISRANKQKMGKALFVQKAKEIHCDKYDYSSIRYESNRKHIKIYCKLCSEFFMQRPYSHLKGWGHQKCCSDIFSPTEYGKAHPKAILYIIHCWGMDEAFYKIGVTSKSIRKRFNSLEDYQYEILFEKELSGYDARKTEIELHKLHKKYKHIPFIKFSGYTECFSYIDFNKVKEVIKDINVVN